MADLHEVGSRQTISYSYAILMAAFCLFLLVLQE